MMKLTKEDKELIAKAKGVIMHARVEKRQLLAEVGSVLKDRSGNIYTGVSIGIKTSSGGSICGEQGAIAKLVEEGKKEFDTIVAVWVSKDYKKNKEWGILPPCGSCRHVIAHFGNPWIIITKNKKMKLKELYPAPNFLK